MYRTIDTAMWTDPKIRKLAADAKLLFVYLITNPHSHVSGIYYLPDTVVVHETGIKPARLDTLWDTLSKVGDGGIALRDRVSEVIWVKKMLDRQGPGHKNDLAAARQLSSLHNCKLIKEFLQFYSHRQIPYRIGYPDVGLRAREEQEQEQEQDREQEQDSSSLRSEEVVAAASGPPPPNPASEPSLLTFPCSGAGPDLWNLIPRQASRWSELFPGVDVLGECRKALAWVEADTKRRKTHGGMCRFLTRWLTKAQDGFHGNGKLNGKPQRRGALTEGIE